MKSTDTALEIKHLTKRYGQARGINDISLTIAKGEVFGFLGPNGAGKSTTINTILDILRPEEGTVTILGFDHREVKQVHHDIGYLAGDMETDPSLTGAQYLSFVAHLYRNVDKSYTNELIKRLKVTTSTKIKHLSRGNKQKIGLVAALMHKPQLLILDEPTSGLDPLMQAEFNQIINEHKVEGRTAFISSHVLSEVQSICDRVGFIRGGKLITVSNLSELLKKASRRVTVAFAAATPKDKLLSLAGVSQFTRNDGTVSFDFNGDVNQLLALLSGHKLRSLEIAEADLEQLFMQYYIEGGSNV